jgi:dTDP-4-amino-4,6-dideoxygalactose transaminase
MSVASSLARRVLSLPIYPELTDGEVEFVAETVKKWLTKP